MNNIKNSNYQFNVVNIKTQMKVSSRCYFNINCFNDKIEP